METGEQLNLFKGRELRDDGIQRALDNAEARHAEWPERAYLYLLYYCTIRKVFMAEEVRVSSRGYIPTPPSLRAWGAVFVRGVREGIIVRKGYRQVSNAKAHCTPATLWKVV